MELKNKRIAFLGDSITEGVGTSSIDNVYWKVFGRLTGAEVFGYGIGGTTIAPQMCQLSEQEMRFFESRVNDMIPDADAIVVFGGTNDFGHGDVPFGRIGERNGNTFCAAFHSLMCKLICRYPQAQIVALTPLHRLGENDVELNEIGVRRDHTLEDYAEAEKAICAYYAIPVLDLYRTSGIQPEVPILRECYMPDGLHPSDAGNRLIAQKLAGFMTTL